MLPFLNDKPGNIWLYNKPIDMRKSIDGLSIVVSEQLNQQPASGDLFVFYSKGKDKIKILFFETNGFCLFYKRLEEEKFILPNDSSDSKKVTYKQLRWLLEGLDIDAIKGHKRLNYNSFY